jgi:hypothetical protein
VIAEVRIAELRRRRRSATCAVIHVGNWRATGAEGVCLCVLILWATNHQNLRSVGKFVIATKNTKSDKEFELIQLFVTLCVFCGNLVADNGRFPVRQKLTNTPIVQIPI